MNPHSKRRPTDAVGAVAKQNNEIVAMAVGIVIVALLALFYVARHIGGSGDDVSVSRCTSKSRFGEPYPLATVTITNHSSGSRSYVVTVAFESSNSRRQYGTIFVIAALAAGQSTTRTTPGTTVVSADLECKATHV